MDKGETMKGEVIEKAKNKDATFSVMKGIAITGVVVGHTCVGTYCDTFVNQFDLATFFFVAGYFLKEKYLTDLKSFIWRRFKQLYIPFMLFGLLFIITHNLFYRINIESNQYDWGSIFHELRNITIGMTSEEPLMGAMWFCPALLIVSIISATVLKFVKNQSNVFFKLLFIISIPLIGWTLCLLIIKSPRCLWEYMQICGIYYAGYYFHKYKPYFTISNKCLVGGVALLLLVVIYGLNQQGFMGNLQSAAIKNENILIMTLIGICGSLAVFYASTLITQKKTLLSNVLTIIGNNSFAIMALHFLSFKLVSFCVIVIKQKEISHLSDFPTLKEVESEWILLYILMGVALPIILNIIFSPILKPLKFIRHA